jgi:hypothetical protein
MRRLRRAFVGYPLKAAMIARRRLVALLSTLPPVQLARHKQALRAQLAAAEVVVSRLRPQVMVIAEDNVEYDTAAWIRAGHSSGAATVIVPFTIATALEPAESYKDSRAHSAASLRNRAFARDHPHWVYVHEGRPLLRVPAPQARALEDLGLAPPRPWAHNSGHADRIAVESEAMLRHYLAQGLRPEVLAVTGAPSDDVLAAGRADAEPVKARIRSERRLPPDAPIVLCAFPPDQVSGGRADCEYAGYRELAAAWLECLGQLRGCVVLVTLHPRTRAAGLPVPLPAGVEVSTEETLALVPYCDVFVASVSATIRWAIACGIPVVNYDVYRFRYRDYSDVPGTLTVETRKEFEATLSRLTLDRDYLANVAGQQRAVANYWGLVDGRGFERIRALLYESAQRHRTPAS